MVIKPWLPDFQIRRNIYEAQNQQGKKRLHLRAIIGDAKSRSLSFQRRIMLEVACCFASHLWSCDKRSTTMLLYAPRSNKNANIGCATDEHNFKSRMKYIYFQYCSQQSFLVDRHRYHLCMFANFHNFPFPNFPI